MIAVRHLIRCSFAAACAWLPIVAPAAAQFVETVGGCIQCHQTAPRQNDFCTVAAGDIWLNQDPHRWAFYRLHESDPADPAKGQAKRELVARMLGFDLKEAFADGQYSRLSDAADAETRRKVDVVKACLRCHATWPVDADQQHAHTPPVPPELGVSCQACHGPGERWLTPHLSPAWRLVAPAGKASLGFADCRSTAAKSRMCASCHIGNLAEGKFVKHAWYAAGHPPLPSLELAEFEAAMPAHWKSLRDKGPFALRDPQNADLPMLASQIDSLKRLGVPPSEIKASYREANFPAAAESGVDPFNDLPRQRGVVIGGAVAFETQTRLAGDYAHLTAAGKQPWPELALYDCTACHHELKAGRPVRTRPGRHYPPGRPPPPVWPAALAQLAVFQTAGYDPTKAVARWSPVEQSLIDFERATTIRPFGDPAQIESTAQPLAAALAQLAADASLTQFDDRAAAGALGVLTDADRFDLADFATARQLAWAIRGIAADRGAGNVERLFLRGPDDVLALAAAGNADQPGPRRGVMPHTAQWLSAAAKYDPAWFRAALQSARGELLPGRGR